MQFLRRVAAVAAAFICALGGAPLTAMAFDASLFYNNNIIFYDDSEDCIEEDCLRTNGDDVSFIGDSIGVGLKDYLAEQLTELDTSEGNYNSEVSRPWNTGVEIAKTMELKDIVIFELGTNSSNVTQESLDELVDIIGVNKTLVLITNYGDNGSVSPSTYDANNALFKQNAQDKDNIVVVDWASAVAEHASEWLSDGVHPTATGNEELASLIYEALNSCTGSATSSGGVTLGDNKDYAGNQIFSDEELAKIEEFQPLYEEAAEATGVPWQFIAVLHYRESRLSKSNPSNGQGIFQLYTYVNNTGHRFPPGEVSDEEFVHQATLAAEEVVTATPELAENPTDDVVKLAFFRYNGTAQAYINQARDLGFSEEEARRGEGSPYVMNKADEKRDPNKNGDNWCQIKTDGGGLVCPANQDHGAYVLYVALGGGVGDLCIGGNGDIADTAWDLAWHEGESGWGGLDPTPKYAQANVEVGLSTYPDAQVQRGSSCDAFVSVVYRYSGVDPEFMCCGTPSQVYWLRDNDEYEFISDSADTSYLQSGDVLIVFGHIKLYIEHDGSPYEAQASYGSYAGRTTDGVNLVDGRGRGNYMIFRKK